MPSRVGWATLFGRVRDAAACEQAPPLNPAARLLLLQRAPSPPGFPVSQHIQPLPHALFTPPSFRIADARASRSFQTFAREREEEKAGMGADVSMDRWLVEQNRLVPPAQPMLAVDNFNLENLEGKASPPNSTSQDRRFSAR